MNYKKIYNLRVWDHIDFTKSTAIKTNAVSNHYCEPGSCREYAKYNCIARSVLIFFEDGLIFKVDPQAVDRYIKQITR